MLTTDAGLRGSPGALLTMADYCGTLAAARLLGREGVPVTVADPSRHTLAGWSRFASRRVVCPSLEDTDRLLAWLLRTGDLEPGQVLYPTCDEYAWLIALHASALARHYRLYSPPVEAVEALLDKKSLHGLCEAVGLQTPASWFPSGEEGLDVIAREATFPVLIKQRTQILSATHTKGVLVQSSAELLRDYRAFVSANVHGPAILDRSPQMCQPMLQEYFPEAVTGSLLVAGFLDHTGQHHVMRASSKLLQTPPRLGIALCLEEASLEPSLEESILSLCRAARYHGVFQMEFIRAQGRHLLIDFNPRYYHHLAFEIARGMPLPVFAHLAATGRHAELSAAVATARENCTPSRRIFAHGGDLKVVLMARRLAGRMPRATASELLRRYRDGAVDAVRDRGDRAPGLLDGALNVWSWVRHPLSLVGYLRR